jgi:hypothetical protein
MQQNTISIVYIVGRNSVQGPPRQRTGRNARTTNMMSEHDISRHSGPARVPNAVLGIQSSVLNAPCATFQNVSKCSILIRPPGAGVGFKFSGQKRTKVDMTLKCNVAFDRYATYSRCLPCRKCNRLPPPSGALQNVAFIRLCSKCQKPPNVLPCGTRTDISAVLRSVRSVPLLRRAVDY